MSKPHFTHQELVDNATDTFRSNPDVDSLLATTHDGAYYRPEFRSYAESAAAKADSEVVEIRQLVSLEGEPGPAITPADTLADEVAGAVTLPTFFAPAAEAKPAKKTNSRKAATKKAAEAH
jgi:hypothetical protein